MSERAFYGSLINDNCHGIQTVSKWSRRGYPTYCATKKFNSSDTILGGCKS